MTVIEQFRTALAASAAQLPGPELLPERLARACARALPIDGAGISLFFADDRRLPLGASDPSSAEAERLQFTVGEGPCLAAHAEGRPLLADEATLRSRWPAFYDCLVGTTRIRATLSLPLADHLQDIGALDLYLVPPHDPGALCLADVEAVTREVGAAFGVANGRGGQPDGPAWLDAPGAARRATVWQALGMVNAALRLSSADALAVLRAHAYGTGTSLDDLASRVVDRQVSMADLGLDTDQTR